MMDPTANFTGPFPFFNLPRELRDMIYHRVWPVTAKLQHHMRKDGKRQLHVGICYNVEEGYQIYHNVFPEWLLVSNRFLNEAMEQFYRFCHIWGQVPGSYMTTNIRFGSPTDHNCYLTDADLTEIMHGDHKLPGYIPDADYSNTAIEVIKSWPTNLSILKKMEKSLLGKDGKTLSITFAVALHRIESEPSVDLSAFEATGFNLDKLIVEVIGIAAEGFDERANKLFPVLEAEVARLGRQLVGEGSQLTFKEEEHIKLAHSSYWSFEVSMVGRRK